MLSKSQVLTQQHKSLKNFISDVDDRHKEYNNRDCISKIQKDVKTAELTITGHELSKQDSLMIEDNDYVEYRQNDIENQVNSATVQKINSKNSKVDTFNLPSVEIKESNNNSINSNDQSPNDYQ